MRPDLMLAAYNREKRYMEVYCNDEGLAQLPEGEVKYRLRADECTNPICVHIPITTENLVAMSLLGEVTQADLAVLKPLRKEN